TVIVCGPRPTMVPATGLWVTVIALVWLQLSLTVTPLRTLGTAAWQLAPALALVGAGQLTVGAVVSFTVNAVVQVALLPAASVAVTVIVCGPRPTMVPATGLWVTVIALESGRVSCSETAGITVGGDVVNM